LLKNAYNISAGKPEWKRLLGRPRRRWEDNIKTDYSGIGCEDVDWIHVFRGRGL
jgi:hypothetical protein